MKKSSFILSACTTFLLSGAAWAANDPRDVVKNQDETVVNTFGNCVRTKWDGPGDPCTGKSRTPVEVAAPQERVSIAREERTVYFEFNKATLTPQAQQKLNSLAEKLKSDKQVQQARIVGYADRIGQTNYNEMLSMRRANTVASYLSSRGFINSKVAETRWLGESEPKTNCPDNLSRPELIECLQKDRRVEVEIDYLPIRAASQ